LALDNVAGDVLSYWFGIEFWRKTEPRNPTAFYDDLWQSKWFAKEQLTKQVLEILIYNCNILSGTNYR
jgi:hypothetical protein